MLTRKRRIALRMVELGAVRYMSNGQYSEIGRWVKIPQRQYRWLQRKRLISIYSGSVQVTTLGRAYLS